MEKINQHFSAGHPAEDADKSSSSVIANDQNPFATGESSETEGNEVAPQSSAIHNLVGGSGEEAFVYHDVSGFQSSGDSFDNLEIFDNALDLGSLNPIAMSGVNLEEALDTYLSFSPQDVQNLSSTGHLYIEGGVTEQITLKGDWIQGESHNGYTVYTAENSMISVDNSIVDSGGVHIVIA